jgi:hypothetical protein
MAVRAVRPICVPIRAPLGGTLIALSVEKCNAGQFASAIQLGGRGMRMRRARLMPARAMSGAAFRVMAVAMALLRAALLRAPVIAAGAALFLLMRPVRLMAGVRLMRLVRARLRVPAAIGRRDRRPDQLLDVA